MLAQAVGYTPFVRLHETARHARYNAKSSTAQPVQLPEYQSEVLSAAGCC